jgi:CRISP-associated protein Cas1
LTGENTIPVEDIGIVILDNPQLTITHSLIEELLENNVALITCNSTHHPTGLMLNLDGNKLQSLKFKAQIEASVPLKKQLWQQTIKAKITNQASLLKNKGYPYKNMLYWVEQVKSGDSGYEEARAAGYYWQKIFSRHLDFSRKREGNPPNNLLNYGYAILRAITARSLVSSIQCLLFG